MAKVEVRIPRVFGDVQVDYSITSGDLEVWYKEVGAVVEKGELLCEVNISKAMLPVHAPVSGILVEILAPKGKTVALKMWDQDEAFFKRVIAVIETQEGGGESQHQKEKDSSPPSSLQQKNEKTGNESSEPISSGGEPAKLVNVPPAQVSVASSESKERAAVLISPQARIVAEDIAKQRGISVEGVIEEMSQQFPNRRLDRELVGEFAKGTPAPPGQSPAGSKESTVFPEKSHTALRISLNVRKRARELGVKEDEIYMIQGTGPGGAIMEGDLENYMGIKEQEGSSLKETEPKVEESRAHEQPSNKTEPEPQSKNGGSAKPTFTIVKQPAIRRTIAQNMEEGWKKPTAQSTLACKMSRLLLFKENYGELFEKRYGVKLPVAFPLVAALARVMGRKEFEHFNAQWVYETEKDEDETLEIGAIRVYEQVNIGVSFATPKGLVILTVREANTLPLAELVKELVALGRKAQEGKHTLQDQIGFTFIFNNVGGLRMPIPEDLQDEKDRFEFSHEMGFSILTRDIGFIFNLGAINRHDGSAKIQICFDHRLADGEHATRLAYETYCEMFRIIRELENELKSNKASN